MALLTAACSPSYNWREVRSAADAYAVLMPARTAVMTREIDLDGERVIMAMTGARVDRSLFTVGTIALAPELGDSVERLLAAMREGMLRNIAAPAATDRAVVVSVLDGTGRVTHRVPAVRVDARGTVSGQPVRMAAVFVARGARLWQAVAIEPVEARDEAATLLDSFRLLE
jgi:hypothetical protein